MVEEEEVNNDKCGRLFLWYFFFSFDPSFWTTKLYTINQSTRQIHSQTEINKNEKKKPNMIRGGHMLWFMSTFPLAMAL